MRRAILAGIVSLCVLVVTASAATRKVPGDYPSIQMAIQDCNDGDTVVVAPGVYYETINFGGRDITVTSADPNDPKIVGYTIINADDDGSPVTFENGETPAAVLIGFTITGGIGTVNNSIEGGGVGSIFWGGGIYCYHASPTITKNIITGNHSPFKLDATDLTQWQVSYGGGIACLECSPVITHNVIRRNDAYVAGALIVYIGEPVINNNLVYDNSAILGGGVILIGGGPFYNNTLVGNDCSLSGGLDIPRGGNLYIVSDPTLGCPYVLNNIISDAPSGGGIYMQGTVPPDRMAFNDVWNNLPGNYGTLDSQQGNAVRYDADLDRTGKAGNISADPLYVNLLGKDFHLTAESPCINAGDPSPTVAMGRTDMDRNPRIYARRIDIGADEYVGYVKPAAFAGPDQHVLNPLESVMLDGSGSFFYDPCGVTKFQWTQVKGTPVVLSEPNAARPTFVPGELGQYVFELVVADDQRTGESDQVLVLVAENNVPVASAGADRVWQTPGIVTLDGTGSRDADAVDKLSYTWRQIEGPAVELRDADTATPSFSCSGEGQYVFELVVSDGFADSRPSRTRHTAVSVTKGLEGRSTISSGGQPAYYPDVSGSRVVYVNSAAWQIACKDLNSGVTQTFTGGSSSGLNIQPKIDGDLLVWSGDAIFTTGLTPVCTSVFVRNVATGAQQVLRARSDTSSFSHPAVSGSKAVWVQHLGIDTNVAEKWYNMPYDICGADLSDLKKPKYFIIAAAAGRCDPFPVSNLGSDSDIVDICDDMVVWEGNGDIYAAYVYDTNDIRIFTVCNHPGRQYDPSISGRFVVWTDERNDQGDIYGADISDLDDIREFAIVRRPGFQHQPAIDQHQVVYVDGGASAGRLGLACMTRSHGFLDVDLPEAQLGMLPVLDGTTLVCLESLQSTLAGYWLSFAYSIADGPVQNARTGRRYDYIQHAISDAGTGDEIVVGQRSYLEMIDFAGKAITVRSADPTDPAIVAGTVIQNGNTLVTFARAEGAGSVLDGLTLMWGDTGVLCYAASPTITRCNINANRGPGIELQNQSNPQITKCRITANEGPGIDMPATGQGRIIRHSQPVIRNCIIAANRKKGINGGKPTITNCTVVENLQEGILAVGPVVRNSIVYFNNGGGAQITSGYVTVAYSDIEGGWEGDGNIQADPCFVAPGRWVGGNDSSLSSDQPAPGAVWWTGDYHLKSEGRRWDSLSRSWVSDATTSPCIDAGDPASPLLDEPANMEQPDGQPYVNTRIDMGAYGGTAEASLAPPAGG
jgi:beta propeller repeat protein/parallel beta-helix repeat protein